MASINTGATLGGAAGARDRRKTRELEEQRIGLAQRQFEVNRQTDLLQTTREQIAKLSEQATGLVSNIPVGRDDPRFQAAIAPIREALASLASRAEQSFPGSVNAQAQLSLFDSAVAGTPTQFEAAAAETAAEIESAKTTSTAAAGADRTTRILLGTEPLSQPDIVRLQAERDAAEQRGDTRRATELTDIINKRGTVTGTTEFDPTGPGFAEAMVTPTEDDVVRLRTRIRDNQTMASTVQNTLAVVEEAGGFSTGFVGAGTETITGILSQLGAVGDAINAGIENVTGANLERLTAARTRMREGVASALPEITNEDSGRFTKDERELANNTLRGMGLDADIDQVMAAYRTFFQIINDSDVRNAGEIARGSGLDLTQDDGINQLSDILKANGMADDRILEVLNQVVPQ